MAAFLRDDELHELDGRFLNLRLGGRGDHHAFRRAGQLTRIALAVFHGREVEERIVELFVVAHVLHLGELHVAHRGNAHDERVTRKLVIDGARIGGHVLAQLLEDVQRLDVSRIAEVAAAGVILREDFRIDNALADGAQIVRDRPRRGETGGDRLVIAVFLQLFADRIQLVQRGRDFDAQLVEHVHVVEERLAVHGPRRAVLLAVVVERSPLTFDDLAGPLAVARHHVVQRQHAAGTGQVLAEHAGPGEEHIRQRVRGNQNADFLFVGIVQNAVRNDVDIRVSGFELVDQAVDVAVLRLVRPTMEEVDGHFIGQRHGAQQRQANRHRQRQSNTLFHGFFLLVL